MLERWDYAAYGQLLARLLREHRNICFRDFARGRPKGKYFILRHDVDYSPQSALKMAELEAGMKVRATYFLLTSAEHYNLLSAEHCSIPARLVELGHEAGLHYDLAAFEAAGEGRVGEMLAAGIGVLEALTGGPVRSIAMHNPSLSGQDPFRNIRKYVNAYNARFTKDIAYFSDSCGAWRNEARKALEGDRLPDRLQVLIHPIFWDAGHADRWRRLAAFIEGRLAHLRRQEEEIARRWARHPGVIEYDAQSPATPRPRRKGK